MYATTVVAAVDVKESRVSIDDVKTRYLAETGLERGIHFLDQAVAKLGATDPIGGLAGLFAAESTLRPLVGERILNDQAHVGSITVSLTLASVTATSVSIQVDATGYLPDAPSALPPGERPNAWSAVSAVATYSLEPSSVFDNAYFINNWGWLYGSSIYCNGNARSNGQFDAGGYAPTITGQPTFDSVAWDGVQATLSGYHDDNGDGAQDGNDGGVFSGWDIVNAARVAGNGGLAKNQHDFEPAVPMPNLTDLSVYEQLACCEESRITIAGNVVSDGVSGDEAGELENLYLYGTAADPIVLDGPVVVRGDVIIHGYVTGQGAIYAGGNVYVPSSVKYLDPPTTRRPGDNGQAATEAWLAANWDKDFLGLFARENVVVGDYTNSTWQHYVGSWMNSSLNESEEDAGEDLIPSTYAGRDGIAGTADDDVLEGDGLFTIAHYTDQDAALGLIPAGNVVGDPIPGTGEDIDGDGEYDPRTTLSDLYLTSALDPTAWGGNMPAAGISAYRDIATLYASDLDAVFYTNHSFCWTVLGSNPARINGSLVSRNENIVYGTPRMEVNYDCRLLGGHAGMAGDLLPRVVGAPTVDRWRVLERDPNRYAVQP